MPNLLFVKKSIVQLQQEAAGVGETYTLKRTLGPVNLVLLGIGAIIGAGLFSLTGIAAAHHAGPAVTLSYVIAAVGCAFAALCYAEFASMIPIAGSAYTYSYATMGELIAWIIGWDLVLEYAVGAATVAVSWSRYLSRLLENFNIHLPAVVMMSPFEHQTMPDGTIVHGIVNLPALLVIFIISAILIRGTRESAAVNAVIVALKVCVVITFIILGWQYIDPANYVPYIPPNLGQFEHFGWTGVITGAGIVFFAFIGFDAVSTAAQEARNPQKDMPIGILGSLAVCTVLYVLFAHVLTGIENYKHFAGEAAPVARAIAKTPYVWLQQAIIIAILAGFTSVILVMLLGQSRVFYSISRDGLLPKVFSEIHPRFRTPWKSNMLFAVFVGSLAGFLPITIVGEMTSIGTLFAFILVSLGVLFLRYTQPNLPRAFRTPWVPFVPMMGVLTCAFMMYGLPYDTWIRLFVWMAMGLLIYFGYGARRSLLRRATLASAQN